METCFYAFRTLVLFLAFVAVNVPTLGQTRKAPQNNAEINLSFAPIVRRAGPAVVNIYARKVVEQRRGWMFDDPFFRRFFGDESPFGGGNRKRVENSLGSGVIVTADGFIVTNNHVIKDANDIKVVLADRREFDATLLLKDKRTDIAVLKIDTGQKRLPIIELADSDSLEVGDLVLALGNPFGVGRTVTSGIVSALARTSVGITDYQFFIQTDAAINPGNSGGALVDMSSQLIGINTAIYSRDGGSLGIGFAVPSNMVRAILTSAISGKPLVRPSMSFVGKNVTLDIANAIGLDRPFGVLVEEVHEGGPADVSGLQQGDVIQEVNAYPYYGYTEQKKKLFSMHDMIDASRQLREIQISDPHRPTYHFINPEGWGMPFDPNGTIYWNGRYHMFYIVHDERGHILVMHLARTFFIGVIILQHYIQGQEILIRGFIVGMHS